jgi:hypothetical protein
MSYEISHVTFYLCAEQLIGQLVNRPSVNIEICDHSNRPPHFECLYTLGRALFRDPGYFEQFEIKLRKNKKLSPDKGKCPSTAKLILYNDGTGRIVLESESGQTIAEGRFNPKQVSRAIDKLNLGILIDLSSKPIS